MPLLLQQLESSFLLSFLRCKLLLFLPISASTCVVVPFFLSFSRTNCLRGRGGEFVNPTIEFRSNGVVVAGVGVRGKNPHHHRLRTAAKQIQLKARLPIEIFIGRRVEKCARTHVQDEENKLVCNFVASATAPSAPLEPPAQKKVLTCLQDFFLPPPVFLGWVPFPAALPPSFDQFSIGPYLSSQERREKI